MAEPLNRWILAEIDRIPLGGGYRFDPAPRLVDDPVNPRDPSHDGVTRDIEVRGDILARSAADGATYCCGMTFEVWLQAWMARGMPLPATVGAELVSEWFCPVMGHAGASAALVGRGLGLEVEPGDARPGDLVQFWRSVDLAQPSGHSAVFLGWEQKGGERRIRYWSSQPATEGIGVHEEVVGEDWHLFMVRAT